MAYIYVFPLAYRNTNILFSLANRFIELAASSQECSYGRGKCTSCAVQVTAFYFGVGVKDTFGQQGTSFGRRLFAIKHITHVVAL